MMNRTLSPSACWADIFRRRSHYFLASAFLLFSFLLLASMSAPSHAVQGQTPSVQTFAAGEVIVRFNEGVSAAAQSSALSAAGCQGSGSLSTSANLTLANVTSGRSVSGTVALLNANASVAYAEPNYILTAQVVPNDTLFTDLWGMNNTGQTGGTPDADIDGPEAWDIQTGTRVVVAVIDTGLDYNHEDIVGNVWSNPGEIPNNGIDDDNNGFIDDDKGWDFANNDNDPFDDNRHGTHVSGTIAAVGNNALGVTGVNWSAQIMPLKFLDATGAGTTANAIRAIEYATMMGVRVSNNSWGGGPFSQALFDAISAAGAAGQVFVAAAGNDGVNTDVTPSYPASYDLDNIISVAATDDNDLLATFSNFGAVTVDLGAPGVDILSTTPPAAAGGGGGEDGGMGGMGGMGGAPAPAPGASTYTSLSGTSMASPHVAGTVALILASNPTASVAELKDTVLSAADLIASLAGITVTGGRLNAFTAVSGQGITVTPDTATVVVGDTLQFSANGGQSPYTWSLSNAAAGSIDPVSGLFSAAAAGTTTVTATDDNGDTGVSGTITVVNTPPVAVTLTPATATLIVGDTQLFSAAGGAAPYAWTVSNPAVISVNAAGLVTALSAGTATVTATDANGIAGTASVTVNVATPANIVITPNTATVPTGGTQQFTANGGVAPYTWSLSTEGAGTIDAATGLFTAGGEPATTTVIATDANGVTGESGTITVVNAAPVVVTLTPATATLVVGDTQLFSAAGGTPPYTWSVSNPNVISVNAVGLVTALAAGSATVTATDANGIAGSASVTVNAAPANIVITPNTATVPTGGTQQFSAAGGVAPYTWSLSTEGAGTINATTGLFTAGDEAATTTVIATDANGATGESGTITVVVAAPAPPPPGGGMGGGMGGGGMGMGR